MIINRYINITTVTKIIKKQQQQHVVHYNRFHQNINFETRNFSLSTTNARMPFTTTSERNLQLEFSHNGYIKYDNLITLEQVDNMKTYYNQLLSGEVNCEKHRYDLGAGETRVRKEVENITQIMWPSDLIPALSPLTSITHIRALKIAQSLLGDDLVFDFDMIINKSPQTNVATPWHQDEAYWIAQSDRRAVSCWIALDQATIDNGCMWFIPKAHLSPLRAHRKAGNDANAALQCDASESEGIAIPLTPGSATFHHGRTPHYTRGNSTHTHRRAYIINFRPKAMVEYERAHGFDHGRAGHKIHEIRSQSKIN